MLLNWFEKGFNYSQDGPGNRLVYHLQGCNLHCPWCSNPEGMSFKAIKSNDVEEIIAEILSCEPMFFDGGGVTFTGGECSLQSAALKEIISKIHEKNISVAIESNAEDEAILELAPLCDYIILDVKHTDKEKASKVIGGNLASIKHIEILLKTLPLHFRIPLIHGFNDDDKAIVDFINFFKSLNGEFDVEILPYHEYGKDKWLKMNKEYQITNGYVPSDVLKKINQAFKEAKIKIIHT